MRLDFLDLCECPFCGTTLTLQPDSFARVSGSEVEAGILACQCCAFPVVGGIAYLRTGSAADAAMTLLGERAYDGALRTLLALDPAQQAALDRILSDGSTATFRSMLGVFSPNLEGEYLFNRFSDPTFLSNEALASALVAGSDDYVLDICGGTGHLARRLAVAAPNASMVVSDLGFWRLWLAKHFVAPTAQFVCCDAGAPLPFRRGGFALTICADAFHYIWHRRQLATEMMRLVRPGGTVLLGHLHNALVDNPSAGMPLTASAYRHLFAPLNARLFRDSAFLDAAIRGSEIDLTPRLSDDALADEAALMLVASDDDATFRRYTPAARLANSGPLRINPLYLAEETRDEVTLSLRFPSEHYADEFAASLSYLPQTIVLPRQALSSALQGDFVEQLASAPFVCMDFPDRYL